MSAPRLKKDVRFRRVADEAVVLRQTEAEVLVLNDVAARVLELVGNPLSSSDEPLDLDQIVELLLGEYDVEREELAADVERFVAELVERGVLEPTIEGK